METTAAMATDCEAYYRSVSPVRWRDAQGTEVAESEASARTSRRVAEYAPSIHAQGAWLDHEQHMAPVSGVLTHEIEQFFPRPGLQLSRLTFEILGVIAARPFTITTWCVRPGSTIELIESVLEVDGRAAVRCRAWRLVASNTSGIAGGDEQRMASPESMRPWDGRSQWKGGYIRTVDFRACDDSAPGYGHGWIRTSTPLIEGQPTSELAQYVGLVDTANGIAPRVSPLEWMFPNTDLTIHFFRQPWGPWVGFDTRAIIGPTGVGLTSSTLFDLHGPVGRAEQILTVRPLPPR